MLWNLGIHDLLTTLSKEIHIWRKRKFRKATKTEKQKLLPPNGSINNCTFRTTTRAASTNHQPKYHWNSFKHYFQNISTSLSELHGSSLPIVTMTRVEHKKITNKVHLSNWWSLILLHCCFKALNKHFISPIFKLLYQSFILFSKTNQKLQRFLLSKTKHFTFTTLAYKKKL